MLKLPDNVYALIQQSGTRQAASEPQPDSQAFHIDKTEVRRIRAALGYLGADNYDNWVQVGMALYELAGGSEQLFALWNWWSASSPKYQSKGMKSKWRSFASDRADKITENSFWYLAHAAGFQDIPSGLNVKPLAAAIERASLRTVDWADFEAMELPKPVFVLDPVIPSPGLVFIHAWAGVGKTQLSIGIGVACAAGSDFLLWKGGDPVEVAFLDGEMNARTLRDRLELAVKGLGPLRAPLRIATPDLNLANCAAMPDLGTPEGQSAIDDALSPTVKVIIVDNCSSWIRTGEENSAEYWLQVQPWALRHRAAGRTVVFIDHDGKSRQSFRGTSKKADVMDVMLHLQQPDDYDPSEGARFIVHTSKSRLSASKPDFEAQLSTDSGAVVWNCKPAETRQQKVHALKEAGLKQREIAHELGIGIATVNRDIKSNAAATGKRLVDELRAGK